MIADRVNAKISEPRPQDTGEGSKIGFHSRFRTNSGLQTVTHEE